MSSKPKSIESSQLPYVQAGVNIKTGSDPEFFFTHKGKIIGAEHIISENGMTGINSKVIIDSLNGGKMHVRELIPTTKNGKDYKFIKMVDKINKEGISSVFGENPMNIWTGYSDFHSLGWNEF